MQFLYCSDDIWTLGQTVLGEALDRSDLCKVGVAWVAINRAQDDARRWPRTVAGVCKQPHQFTCWRKGSAASYRLLRADLYDFKFRHCYSLASMCLSASNDDPTNGSTFYLPCDTESIPSWAQDKRPEAILDDLAFYRL